MSITLVPQTATGDAAGANTYDTLAGFKTYCTNHGYDISSYTDDQLRIALIKGLEYLDNRFPYKGTKVNGIDQITMFPRDDLTDKDGNLYVGVPTQVLYAQDEYAFRAASGPLYEDKPTAEGGRTIASQSDSVGPLSSSVSYEASNISTTELLPEYPPADRILFAAGIVQTTRRVDR